MKIFEIQFTKEDERAWIYAETIIDAIKTYCYVTGTDLVDFDSNDDIAEIPVEKWSKFSVTDEENDGVPNISFKQWVWENEEYGSDVIATTAS